MKEKTQYIILIFSCLFFVFIINQETLFLPLMYIFLTAIFIFSLINYKFSLLIYLAIFPLQSRYLILGYLPRLADISFNRCFTIILLMSYVIYYINRQHESQKSKLNGLLFVLLLLDVLSSLFSNSGLEKNSFKSISIATEVIMVPIIFGKVFDKGELQRIIYSFGIGVLFLSTSGAIERLMNTNLLWSFPILKSEYLENQDFTMIRDGVERIRGSFYGPVQYATFIPLMAMTAMAILISYRNYIFGIILTVLIFMNIIYLITRTAAYSCLFMIFMLVFIYRHKIQYSLIIIVSLFLLAVSGQYIFQEDIDRTVDLTINPTSQHFDGGNTQGRMKLLTEGIPFMLKSNPFGIGWDDDFIQLVTTNNDLNDMTNFYVLYGVVKGYIYMIFFLYVTFIIIYKINLQRKIINNEQPIAIILAGISATFVALISSPEIIATLPIILTFSLIIIGNYPKRC